MPALQALQGIPSFGGQLGQSLGTGLSQGISGALTQILQQKQQRKALEGLRPIFEQAGFSPEEFQTIAQSGLSPEQSLLALRTMGTAQKGQIKEQEQQRKSQSLLGTVDEMRKITEEGYTGGQFGTKTFGGPLRRKAVQERNKFDTYAITLEGFLRDLTTKGTLPQKTFQELLSRLPNSKLSDRENIGRLDAIEDVIKRHSGINESAPLRKVAKGTKLSVDEARKILSQSGNDPEKARKNAQKLGYEW